MEDAAYGALISQEGEVPDFIKLSYLLRRREAYIEKERQGKADDMHNLKLFIKQKKPHVNAIAAIDINARGVLFDIQEAGLAKVFVNINKAGVDFRDYPDVLKEAISIGRRIQDPLLEFSQLCGPENDILCLRYHPTPCRTWLVRKGF